MPKIVFFLAKSHRMKLYRYLRRTVLVCLCAGSALVAWSQLDITPAESVEELVREDFLKISECVDDGNVFNIKMIGSSSVVGSFANGQEILGMDRGIVFSTGFLSDISGSNLSPETTGVTESSGLDGDLRDIAGFGPSIFDVAGIEFDFMSVTDVASFNYIFASEEYCEYVGSEFNDAFGFFVSGPGIEGIYSNDSENVARLPNGTPVTINNVNHLTNRNLFKSNLLPQDVTRCEIEDYRIEPSNISFDGFTTRLNATFQVVPCETYHIKLVVGDVSDDFLDSAIFLEANSFDLSKILDFAVLVDNKPDTIAFEACQDVDILYRAPFLKGFSERKEYNYFLSGTASSGTDYEISAGTIILQANSRTGLLPVEIFGDDLDEGIETLLLIVEFPTCGCNKLDTTILQIRDPSDDFTASFGPINACLKQEITIAPELDDGAGPYKYLWENGDTLSSISLPIEGEQEVLVWVEDACGSKDSAVARVQLQEVPEAMIEGGGFWCERSDPINLSLTLPGNAPWTLAYSIDGLEQPAITEIEDQNFQLSITKSGLYELLSFSDEYCTGLAAGSVMIPARTIETSQRVRNAACDFSQDAEIEVNYSHTSDLGIVWEGLESTFRQSALGVGTYAFSLIDEDGCTWRDSAVVGSRDDQTACADFFRGRIFVPNAFTPNGDGVNDVFRVFPAPGIEADFTLNIYNRWGGRVFQSPKFRASEAAQQKWSGRAYDPQVFMAVLELILPDGQPFQYPYDVTLIR